MRNNYNYSTIRIVCKGIIKCCAFCKDENNNNVIKEGFCSKCGRPLDKKPGDDCNFIIGYRDRNYRQQNKIHIKCKFCNTVTTV